MGWFREGLARRLCPNLARDADRLWYINNDLDDAVRWLSHEFPNMAAVAKWAIENDRARFQANGERPMLMIEDISKFRDRLRRRDEIRTV